MSNLRTTWTTYSGFQRCTYVLDGQTQTLARDGQIIVAHVTSAHNLALGGFPHVTYGNGSSLETGMALTFHEHVTD